MAGYLQRDISKWRHTRLIVAALAGKRPNQIMSLPGDFDHLENVNPSKEEMRKRLERVRNVEGFKDKWQQYQK